MLVLFMAIAMFRVAITDDRTAGALGVRVVRVILRISPVSLRVAG